MLICKCDKCGTIIMLSDSEHVYVQNERYDLCKECMEEIRQNIEEGDTQKNSLIRTYEQLLREIKEIAFSPDGIESTALLEIRDIFNGENLE